MLSEKQVSVGSLRLNMAVGPPNGPPLLLLHGVMRRWQCFLPVIPALSARWQIHALDAPGHGASDRGDGPYRVADYIDLVTALVREQFNRRVAVYGHSLGSMVAVGVAEQAPANVAALVLEDPPFSTMGSRIRETPLHGYFEQLQAFAGSTRPAETLAMELAEIRMTDPKTGRSQRLGGIRDAASLRFMASCLAHVDPHVLEPIVEGRWLDGFDWEASMKRVQCPTLLVQADESAGGMLVDAEARIAMQSLRDGTLVTLPGVGHLVHWLRPVQMSSLATAFLETIDVNKESR